jgi:hypothetical protein
MWDWVSMTGVQGRISRGGDIRGRDDPGFKPWLGTVDDVMNRFTDRFVRTTTIALSGSTRSGLTPPPKASMHRPRSC